FHHPWRSAEIVPDNLTAFPPSLAVSRDCSRQSYCISTILGGQQRLFQTILLHFHHLWRSAEIVPDNLTAFPPGMVEMQN
ncbi:MAG: hypothetical protein HFP76_00400, partial [Methylococcales symbiont of Iophon sp. n. MRB-2018]